MLQSRRGFLIGAGSLLTAAFVSDARSFIRRTSQPLLASPEQIAQNLYWYEHWNEGEEDGYTLTLGEWTMEPPPAPTWREFFISQGVHKTEREIERICDEHWISPEDFDKPVCERYWAEHFECVGNPSAQAYFLLSNIDLGPKLASARGPLLEFHEGDNHPGSNDRWVIAKDKLSLSLLQARLIDLKMPISIVQGS